MRNRNKHFMSRAAALTQLLFLNIFLLGHYLSLCVRFSFFVWAQNLSGCLFPAAAILSPEHIHLPVAPEGMEGHGTLLPGMGSKQTENCPEPCHDRVGLSKDILHWLSRCATVQI